MRRMVGSREEAVSALRDISLVHLAANVRTSGDADSTGCSFHCNLRHSVSFGLSCDCCVVPCMITCRVQIHQRLGTRTERCKLAMPSVFGMHEGHRHLNRRLSVCWWNVTYCECIKIVELNRAYYRFSAISNKVISLEQKEICASRMQQYKG